MKKYNNIIFDFDGVIMNSHIIKTNAFYYVFSKYGKNIGNYAVKLHIKKMGMPRTNKFNLINKYYLNNNLKKKDLNKIEKIFKDYVLKKIFKMKINKNLLKFIKNSKNKNFYISTGTNQEEIKKICKKMKISKYFSEIFGSPKTKIMHINSIIRNYKIKKNDILFVGDSLSDYNAAKYCGINFICKSNSENKSLFKNFKVKRIYKFLQLYNF